MPLRLILLWLVLRRLMLLRLMLLRLMLRRLMLLLRRLIVLMTLRPMRARRLCQNRHNCCRAHSQRHHPSRELEIPFHLPLQLLTLIRVTRFVRLHRLWQVAQGPEIRNHVVVFQYRQVLVDVVNVPGT